MPLYGRQISGNVLARIRATHACPRARTAVEGSMDRITFYGARPAGADPKGVCVGNTFWRNVKLSLDSFAVLLD